MEQDNNIIQFPKKNIKRTPTDIQKSKKKKEPSYINLLNKLESHIILILEDVYKIDINKNSVNVALILESVRALVLNAHGIDHPLTEFAKTIIDLNPSNTV